MLTGSCRKARDNEPSIEQKAADSTLALLGWNSRGRFDIPRGLKILRVATNSSG